LLAAFLAAPACVTTPPPPRAFERPFSEGEDAAQKGFRTRLADEAPVLDITEKTPAQAKAELTGLFDKVDEKLKGRIRVSPNVECLRNGCARDVYYPDWETFQAVNEAVLLPKGAMSPLYQGPFPLSQSGRAREGQGFVVTWALLYPAKLPILKCPAVKGCAQQ
jgi:hypothetical protein